MTATPKSALGPENLSEPGLSPLAKSIAGLSRKLLPAILQDLLSVTFFVESSDGPTPYASPDGRRTNPCGPLLSPASLLAPPGKDLATTTPDTSSRCSTGSSLSSTLQSLLVNKLRARLDVNGSLEYVLTWKHWDMQSGPRICALRARARPTYDNGCSGWPTPKTPTGGANSNRENRPQTGGGDLQEIALAGWPSPTTPSGGQTWPEGTTGTGIRPDGTKATVNLENVAKLAGWATPRAEDAESSGMRHSRGVADTLSAQVGQDLAGWPTPDTNQRGGPQDAEKRKAGGHSVTLQDAAHGVISTSSPAGTEKRGALNPAHSRWLMGFPAAWDFSGATAMLSCLRLPRNLSKHQKKLAKADF
jgi:hypothetical protein